MRASTLEQSVNGVNGRRWSGLSTPVAVFRWEMKKKGFFEGRSWYSAVALAVAAHESHPVVAAQADAILQAAVNDIRERLAHEAALAAQQAKAQPKEHLPPRIGRKEHF